jgi:hypothetical protein
MVSIEVRATGQLFRSVQLFRWLNKLNTDERSSIVMS